MNGKRSVKSIYGKTRRAVVARLPKALQHAQKGQPFADERESLTRYLTRWCEGFRPRSARLGREPQMGDVITAAIADRIEVSALPFPEARLLDVGTPETLARARGVT